MHPTIYTILAKLAAQIHHRLLHTASRAHIYTMAAGDLESLAKTKA